MSFFGGGGQVNEAGGRREMTSAGVAKFRLGMRFSLSLEAHGISR